MKPESWDEKIQNIPYPNKEDFTVYHVMKKGKIVYQGVCLDELKKIFNCVNPLSHLKDSNHVIERDFNEDEFRICQNNYKKRIQDSYNEFKDSLFQEYICFRIKGRTSL